LFNYTKLIYLIA